MISGKLSYILTAKMGDKMLVNYFIVFLSGPFLSSDFYSWVRNYLNNGSQMVTFPMVPRRTFIHPPQKAQVLIKSIYTQIFIKSSRKNVF